MNTIFIYLHALSFFCRFRNNNSLSGSRQKLRTYILLLQSVYGSNIRDFGFSRRDSCSEIHLLMRFLSEIRLVGQILVQSFSYSIVERFLFRGSAGQRNSCSGLCLELERFLFRYSVGWKDSCSKLWRLERFLFRASAGKRDSCSELRLVREILVQSFGGWKDSCSELRLVRKILVQSFGW